MGVPEEFQGLQNKEQFLLQSRKELEYPLPILTIIGTYKLLWLLIVLELGGSVESW